MKILILEDDAGKKADIIKVIESLEMNVTCIACKSYTKFITKINQSHFDLIVVDLLVPLFDDSRDVQDISSKLLEDIRGDIECSNYKTPMIAVTKFNDVAEGSFGNLNKFDISVITYSQEDKSWENSFVRKIESCIPKETYDFIIVCALDKEANAYIEAGYEVGERTVLDGITCRKININNKKGLITIAPRMGLVSSAILCSRAIDIFKPKLICMSGICAGIEGKSKIYDVIIPEICHQHDSGKWTDDGFIPELYGIQLNHETKLKLDGLTKKDSFIEKVKGGLSLQRDEFPEDCNNLEFDVYLAAASSGSAVVADSAVLANISNQHRKKTAFEMEAYALYESARQSSISPKFFSAKSVVDNGNSAKGDEYHRMACILSAKTVYELILQGIIED